MTVIYSLFLITVGHGHFVYILFAYSYNGARTLFTLSCNDVWILFASSYNWARTIFVKGRFIYSLLLVIMGHGHSSFRYSFLLVITGHGHSSLSVVMTFTLCS
jgi:hypothetical protein